MTAEECDRLAVKNAVLEARVEALQRKREALVGGMQEMVDAVYERQGCYCDGAPDAPEPRVCLYHTLEEVYQDVVGGAA
jgi:hypothetical protein